MLGKNSTIELYPQPTHMLSCDIGYNRAVENLDHKRILLFYTSDTFQDFYSIVKLFLLCFFLKLYLYI